jgi:hypothetical protein
MLNSLNLNLRPLKWSFDSIKTYDPDKMKKVLRKLMIIAGKRPLFFLLLWRVNKDKAKEAEEKRERICKLLAILSRKNPHVYFLLWKHLTNQMAIDDVKSKAKQLINGLNTKLGEANDKIKDKILKLLAVLGKPKPHVYFLLWKDQLKNEKIENLT